MNEMRRIGTYQDKEVYDRPDGSYYVRLRVEGEQPFGAVHDLHKRVYVGQFDDYNEAMQAVAKVVGNG